jgi:hypothetical protein
MENPTPLFSNFPGMDNTVKALTNFPTLERTLSETSHYSTPKIQSTSLPPSYKSLIKSQQPSAPPAYKPNSPYNFKPPSINLPSSREELSAILICDGNVKKIYTTTDGSFFSGEMLSTDFFLIKHWKQEYGHWSFTVFPTKKCIAFAVTPNGNIVWIEYFSKYFIKINLKLFGRKKKETRLLKFKGYYVHDIAIHPTKLDIALYVYNGDENELYGIHLIVISNDLKYNSLPKFIKKVFYKKYLGNIVFNPNNDKIYISQKQSLGDINIYNYSINKKRKDKKIVFNYLNEITECTLIYISEKGDIMVALPTNYDYNKEKYNETYKKNLYIKENNYTINDELLPEINFSKNNFNFYLDITNDSKYIVCGTLDNYLIYLWDIQNGVKIHEFKVVGSDGIDCLSISKDSKYIFSGNGNNITVWNLDGYIKDASLIVNSEIEKRNEEKNIKRKRLEIRQKIDDIDDYEVKKKEILEYAKEYHDVIITLKDGSILYAFNTNSILGREIIYKEWYDFVPYICINIDKIGSGEEIKDDYDNITYNNNIVWDSRTHDLNEINVKQILREESEDTIKESILKYAKEYHDVIITLKDGNKLYAFDTNSNLGKEILYYNHSDSKVKVIFSNYWKKIVPYILLDIEKIKYLFHFELYEVEDKDIIEYLKKNTLTFIDDIDSIKKKIDRDVYDIVWPPEKRGLVNSINVYYDDEGGLQFGGSRYKIRKTKRMNKYKKTKKTKKTKKRY